MERSRRAFSCVTVCAAGAGMRTLVVFAALVMGAPLASALPKVNGSNCSSGWVNNEGALDCFILGEEDMNNGLPNPHYVACSSDGEIFCCVDDNRGAQTCESEAGTTKANVEQQVRAILEGQRAGLTAMDRLSKRLDNLENKLSDQNRKN